MQHRWKATSVPSWFATVLPKRPAIRTCSVASPFRVTRPRVLGRKHTVRGHEHRVQTQADPSHTLTVNQQGEPRSN